MLNHNFSLTSPLTTISELRAWAVAATAVCASQRHLPRFLLSPVQRLGTGEWHLETRDRWGLNCRLGGALLTMLERDWPTSSRTGGRVHLTALGVVRLVAGPKAAQEDAAAAKAEVDRHLLEEARFNSLDDALLQAFPQQGEEGYTARSRWREARHPELDGRTPADAARDSADGLESALALVRRLIADRESRESAGWGLELLPEEAGRLEWSPWIAGAELVTVPEGRSILAQLYEHGRRVGLVTVHGVRGRPEVVVGRHCRIAWLLDETEAAAAQTRLAAAAAAFLRVRTHSRPLGVPHQTPCEGFLMRHLLLLGRRAALSDDPVSL